MSGNGRYYCLWAIVLIIIAFLASCGVNQSQLPIMVIPTKENTAIEATQTMGIPTASPTLDNSTGTMEPTFAYWATAQQARFDSEHTQASETKQAIFNLATSYPQVCGFEDDGVSISPDENWIAADCRYAGDFFRVFQAHGNDVWDIHYSKIFPYYPEFLGSVRVLHWSTDESYLYFANKSCCADVDATTNGDNLYRLNLQNGKWVLLIAGNFNYYSFSPDGQRLIYLLNNQAGVSKPVQLHLLNLVDGKDELINVGNFGEAWIVWKPDGKRLALIAQVGNAYADNRKFALMIVGLDTEKVKTIIPFTEDILDVSAWNNDDVLAISKSRTLEYNGDYVTSFETLYYDLKINQFVTPTSIP